MQDVTLKFLADVPDCIPLLAQWLYDEFHYLIPGKTVEYVIESLHTRINVNKLPLCMVAFQNNEPCGTVSIKISDMDIREYLSPWLASLYVSKTHRSSGIGTYLVKSIQDVCRQLNNHEMFLYTPNAELFYSRLGWKQLEKVSYRNTDVTILRREL